MEYILKKLFSLLLFIIFIVCVVLVVEGQKNIGYPGFGLMMLGVAGIVLCIFIYNKRNN